MVRFTSATAQRSSYLFGHYPTFGILLMGGAVLNSYDYA